MEEEAVVADSEVTAGVLEAEVVTPVEEGAVEEAALLVGVVSEYRIQATMLPRIGMV